MKISDQAKADLEAVVGARNVGTDMATLANYCWNGGVGALPGPKLKHWPAAVVLPETTEEVAALVRACNKHKLKFRPLSSGNGCMYVPQLEGAVIFDLVRMDKIEKIDRNNQMAVIQPFATAGRLMAAAMKQGLTCHVVGAGSGHSPLASATSMLGIGSTGAFTGTNARNILGIEWVTPEGEILRIGSVGDDNWFSEEGPGLGFRGMIRGYMGAHGGLGIFTRIGYKLYPWAGEEKITETGTLPQTGMEVPENASYYALAWNSPKEAATAAKAFQRTGQLLALLRLPPMSYGMVLTGSNNEYRDRYEAGTLPEIAKEENKNGFQVLMMGHSEAQVDYQRKVVDQILAETDGRIVEVEAQDKEILMRGLITSQYVARVTRLGAAATTFGINDSWNLWPRAVDEAEKLVKEDRRTGLVATAEDESHWAWAHENRQLWTEHVVPTPYDKPEGGGIGIGQFARSILRGGKTALGMRAFAAGPLTEIFQSEKSREAMWMRRIKNKIDPNWNADSSFYIPEKPLPGFVKHLRNFALSRPMVPVMHGILKGAGKAGTKKPVEPRKD